MDRLSPNARAIALMIAAILCFTLMDASAKGLTPKIGIIPTLWVRYAGQTLVVLILVAKRMPSVLHTKYPFIQLARSVFLMGATWCFFIGISNVGLSAATAIMNVNPALITLGTALFLNEKLGPRRIVGIAVALVGALIIIRPAGALFSLYAVFPLIAALFYTGYNLTTRFVGKDEDVWTSMLYTALFGTIVLSVLVVPSWQTPDLTSIGLMVVLVGFGTASQLLLIQALSQGESSMLAPFSYVGLLFATFWGFVFFAEVPDIWTIIGALVIAGAGTYVWHRETFR
ncbi:Threonine/homoserine efflux transporter RhtA [Shimia gijangensis]|uniref:Threonine/homoserine efflux transporter RhtA n=1 Tax=Shimia gijangensis TaxID=1470563 RepID=A0A1M6EAV2_9RHOB|nr:DMT family transporter [Shimia gijangensis]SHI82470.1 Threonine/homoserine efflux transporter RhtA [Shimia gijangensis]